MKTKIYGGSDDLIEIDGAISDEINDCSERKIPISCSDGTKGTIVYGENAIWKIAVSTKGKKYLSLIKAVGEDAKHTAPDAVGCSPYSDVLVLDEGIAWVTIGRKTLKNKKIKSAFADAKTKTVKCPSCSEEFVPGEDDDSKESGSFVFVFTGFRNAESKDALEEAGHQVADSVSKRTTHLVIKDLSKTSTKRQKAEDLGCEIWSIDQLDEFISDL